MTKSFYNRDQFKIFCAMLLIAAVMFTSNYIVFTNSTETIYNQARENNKLVVRSMIKSFDECFKEVNNIIYNINITPYPIYDSSGHENLNFNNIFLFLNDAKKLLQQDYIKDFIISLPNSPVAINSDGTSDFRSLFEQKYRNNKYAPDFWRNFIVTKHTMKIIPSTEYTETVFTGELNIMKLIAVVGNNTLSNSKLNTMVFINEEKLLEHVKQQSMIKGSTLIVLDQDRNIIIDTGNDFDTTLWEGIYFGQDKEITQQRGKYEYNYFKSDYNDFIYITKMPYKYEDIFSSMRVNQNIMIVTIFLAVIISVFLSIYLYKPIQNIIKLIGIKDNIRGKKDYNTILSSIEKIQNENKLYKDQFDVIEDEVKRSIFFRLIDDITSYKKLKTQIDTYFKVIFYCKKYTMASFRFEYATSQKEGDENYRAGYTLDTVEQRLQSLLDEQFESSSVFYMENKLFIALIGLEETAERSNVINKLQSIVKELKAQNSSHIITAAVSKFYTQIQECKLAFKDIKMCFAFRNLKTALYVIDAEKLESTSKLYFPAEYIQKLSNCILSGNRNESVAIINEIIDRNINENISYIKFSNIMSIIFNNIISTIGIYGYDNEELLKLEKNFFDKINSINSYVDMREYLNSIIKQITTDINNKKKSKLDNDYILKYIDINYAEDLCLESMAEVCDTTPKYFSNFFKKTTGTNFVEYLNKVRVYHASELLKNTDMPISTIAERVGLQNPSTFASVFKKYWGISSTEYRKDYKNKSV